MKKTIFVISTVVLGLILLQGCETLKGVKKDAVNTGDNITQAANALVEVDRKFQEKYW
jgi:predicted small secreted protein